MALFFNLRCAKSSQFCVHISSCWATYYEYQQLKYTVLFVGEHLAANYVYYKMKMAIIVHCLTFLKNTRMKLCIVFLLVMCTFIVMHIYCHTNILHFWQGLEAKHDWSHDCSDNEDTIFNKPNQSADKSHHANEIIISRVIDDRQQTTLLHINKSVYVKQANNLSTQKENKCQKTKLSVGMKNEQRIVRNIEINTTHINGILMEPIHVNYIRNIYFTVKTTHKYYTNRLFPLMLTWLQTVDKNKVRWH